MPDRDRTRALAYLVAIGSVVVATLLRLGLDPILGTSFPFATLFFAVLFTAWFGGFGPALLACGTGAVASVLFLLTPRGYPSLTGHEAVGGMVLYFGVGLGIAVIGGAMRRTRRNAELTALDAAAQREELRVTMQSIGDAVITTDVDGNVTSLNPVASELTGWSPAAAAGRPLTEVFRIVNEDTRTTVPNPAQRALAEGCVVGLANHTILIARDGKEHPIDDSAAPIRDENGEVAGVVLVFRDVTERRRSDEKLRRNEQELADLFANASVGIHFVDANGIILRANRADLDMLGYEHDEYVGQHIASFHTEPEVIADILARLHAGETLVRYPSRLRCKDGAVKDVLINASVLWRDGKFVSTRCFTLDVTEETRAAEAQALLAAVVESSDDPIITKTLQGKITSWNDGAERLFGWTADEAVGQTITLIIPPERHSEEKELLARIARGERVEAFDTVRVTKSGQRIEVSLRISPVRDRHGRIIGASKHARDVTAARRAERALRDSQERLEDADRRKDQFLATLAHELRNPLAPLRNALEITKRTQDDPAARDLAQAIMARQLDHMQRLVDDLLDVARINSDRLELRRTRLDLATILQQTIEANRPLATAAKIQLTLDLPTEPLLLDADAVRLGQVFSNLLSNAFKYTPTGGRVTLDLRRSGGEAVVTVRDTGRGIPPEMLERVFDMFMQLEPVAGHTQSGLGIGLTLVRRLVELHGGRVSAQSLGDGRGSEFVVRLPLARTSTPHDPTRPAPGERPAPPRRVLVVDDNFDAAESLAMLLRMLGHETAIAHDGEAAVSAAESFRPDLVLLDIGLPKIDGHTAARRIREQPWGRAMLLVALTGWGQETDRRKSREVGFDFHLVKPVDVSILSEMLAAAASEGTEPSQPHA